MQQHLRALEPRVGHARIDVGAHAISDVQVDGVPALFVGDPHLVTAEPGTHTVTVSIDGRTLIESKEVSFHAGDGNPPIEFHVGSGAASDTPAKPEPPKSRRRSIGYVVLGVGVVGLGLGTAFGALALSIASDKPCDAGSPRNDQTRCSRGTTDATISTTAFIAGGLAAIGGAVLVLTAPSSPSKSTSAQFLFIGAKNGGFLLVEPFDHGKLHGPP